MACIIYSSTDKLCVCGASLFFSVSDCVFFNAFCSLTLHVNLVITLLTRCVNVIYMSNVMPRMVRCFVTVVD